MGQFTRLFSGWVGQEGRVVALEPAPACFVALAEDTAGCANARALNVGLGAAETKLPVHLADDPKATIHTFVDTRCYAWDD